MQVSLDTVNMWVQVHALPIGYAANTILERIGNLLGKFVKLDTKNFGGSWKSYSHVRVAIAIEKPLKKHMKLTKRDGSWVWVTFKYERLQTFCFFCYKLGHTDCAYLEALESSLALKDYPYCPKLRANSRRGGLNIGRGGWLRRTLAIDRG